MNLDLVETSQLVQELAERSEAIVVIRDITRNTDKEARINVGIGGPDGDDERVAKAIELVHCAEDALKEMLDGSDRMQP